MNITTRIRRRAVAAAVAVSLLATTPGCSPALFRFAATALVATAAVAVIVHAHDEHYHHHHCGHEYVVVEEREVYSYQGRWEYYDPHDGQWYMYEDLEVY